MRLLPVAYHVGKETYAVVRSDRRTFMIHASFDIQQTSSVLPFQPPVLILAVAFHDEPVTITTTMADTAVAWVLRSAVAAIVELSAARVLDDDTLRWIQEQPRGTVFVAARARLAASRATLSFTYKVDSPRTVVPLGDPSPTVPGMTDITFVGAHRELVGPPPHDKTVSVPRTTMAVTFQQATRPLHHLYENVGHASAGAPPPSSSSRCLVQ